MKILLSILLVISSVQAFSDHSRCFESAGQGALKIESLSTKNIDKEDIYSANYDNNTKSFVVILSNLDKGLAGISYSVKTETSPNCRVRSVSVNWIE